MKNSEKSHLRVRAVVSMTLQHSHNLLFQLTCVIFVQTSTVFSQRNPLLAPNLQFGPKLQIEFAVGLLLRISIKMAAFSQCFLLKKQTFQ